SYTSGGAKTDFRVTSLWKWNVRIKEDPDAIITAFTSGGNAGTNLPYSFTLVSSTSSSHYYMSATLTATLVFFSPAGEFPEEERTISMPARAIAYLPTTHGGWAGSNIYWNGSTLTFDEGTANQNYQGVFFQWGSLVGLDPSGTNGSSWGTSKTVYIPTPGTSAWTNPKAGTGNNYDTWTNILYAGSTVVNNITNRARAILYEVHDPANLVGDICRYLTETGAAPGYPNTKWRMPISNEFNGNYTISGAFNTVSTSDDTGRYSNPNASGYTKSNNPAGSIDPWFPEAGLRHSDGALERIGVISANWSSSPSNNAYNFYFHNVNAYPDYNNWPRTNGHNIRCVKE
ncbi:MAG: hypothetical protein LBR26_12915, partial [Prevotella sp.]|nr:hypothetical protein [Prevotella sp.]